MKFEVLILFLIPYSPAILSCIVFGAGRIFKIGRFEKWMSLGLIGLGAFASSASVVMYIMESHDVSKAMISAFTLSFVIATAIAAIVHCIGNSFRKRAAKTKET